MSLLFKRHVRVVAATVLFEGLRTVFKAEKSTAKEPNTCELTVYNLSAGTRASIRKGEGVAIEAGYEGDSSVIFKGEIMGVATSHEGADILTRVTAVDGATAYTHSRVTESFGKGVSKGAVLERLANALGGIGKGDALSVLRSAQGSYAQGFAATGKASTEFDKALKGTGLVWSIQDGSLVVFDETNPVTPGEIVSLSPTSGLVGSPTSEVDDKGVTVWTIKSLLQGALRPGTLVTVDSKALRGDLRITKVAHSGDTAGGDWYSEAKAVAL